jgi:hypothetical protein
MAPLLLATLEPPQNFVDFVVKIQPCLFQQLTHPGTGAQVRIIGVCQDEGVARPNVRPILAREDMDIDSAAVIRPSDTVQTLFEMRTATPSDSLA